jgi:hypothetical protein
MQNGRIMLSYTIKMLKCHELKFSVLKLPLIYMIYLSTDENHAGNIIIHMGKYVL